MAPLKMIHRPKTGDYLIGSKTQKPAENVGGFGSQVLSNILRLFFAQARVEGIR